MENYYPHAFFKKASGILQSPPSRYLLLNDEIQPNLMCVCCSHEWGVQPHIFLPRPLGPWGGAKRSNIIKYHQISITKSISNIFKPNFVCLHKNERYITYQTGFSFGRLGDAPGVGLGGTVGGWGIKNFFFRNSTRVGV